MTIPSNLYGVVNFGQRLLGRSRRAARAAYYLRNQCNRVLGFYVGADTDPEKNGEAWLVRQLAPRIEQFVDVGANVGNWAELVWRHQPDARGLLLEPAQSALARLHHRFGSDTRAAILAAAVGDRPGKATFFEDPDAGETSSLLGSHAPTGAIPREVEIVTLDAVCVERQLRHIDLLKIDAEGYDLQVLQGAESLLAQQRVAVVQFEYNQPWALAGATLGAAQSLFRKHGYSTFVLHADGLHPFDYRDFGEFFDYSNFVALSRTATSELAGLIRAPI